MRATALARAAAGLSAIGALWAASSASTGTSASVAWIEAVAHADPTLGVGCSLRGTGPVAKGTSVYDQATGGRVLANFTGAVVPATLTSFPADPTTARARVATSTGAASLRIQGFTSAGGFAVYTARDVAVVPGHVWISSAQRVRLVAATPMSLTGELAVLGTASQKVRGTGPCEAFTLQAGVPRAMDVPGNGRQFSSKAATLQLYDDPKGHPVFTLNMIEGTSPLFWSTEARGGFVHIVSRADLTIDAWAKASALEGLKRGEMTDQAIPAQRTVSGAQIAFDGGHPPPLVSATREVTVRARRDEKDPAIGVLEIGAEVYVMETTAGWASIWPRSLGYTPPRDGGFFIPAAEVPRR